MLERLRLESEIHELELTPGPGLARVLARLFRQRPTLPHREYDVGSPGKRKPWQQLPADDQLLLLFDPQTSFVRLRDIQATVSPTVGGTTVKDVKDRGAMSRDKMLKFAKRFVAPLFKTSVGTDLFCDVAGGFGKDAKKNDVRGAHPRVVFVAWATEKPRFGGTVTVALDGADALDAKKGSRSMTLIDEQGRDWDAFPEFKSRPDIVMFHELFHGRRNQTGTRLDDGVKEEKLAIIQENHYRDAIGEKITDISERLKGQFI